MGATTIISNYTKRLFIEPSFIEGMASLLDTANSLQIYNRDLNEKIADFNAIRADWLAVGQDFEKVMTEYKKIYEQWEQSREQLKEFRDKISR